MSRRDPTDLDAEHKARRDRELAERLVRKEQDADLVWLMSDARGRRIAHRLIEHSGIYRTTHQANANAAAFGEGVRAFGLVILDWITCAAPRQYLQMLTEHMSDRSNNDSDR